MKELVWAQRRERTGQDAGRGEALTIRPWPSFWSETNESGPSPTTYAAPATRVALTWPRGHLRGCGVSAASGQRRVRGARTASGERNREHGTRNTAHGARRTLGRRTEHADVHDRGLQEVERDLKAQQAPLPCRPQHTRPPSAPGARAGAGHAPAVGPWPPRRAARGPREARGPRAGRGETHVVEDERAVGAVDGQRDRRVLLAGRVPAL
jgi:hypothetical protein